MKDPSFAIFLKNWGFKDVKYDILMCQSHSTRRQPIQLVPTMQKKPLCHYVRRIHKFLRHQTALGDKCNFFSTVSTSPGGKFGQKSPPKSPLLVERNHILIQTTQFILQCNALRAFAVSYLDNQYRSQYNPDSFALISVYAVMHLRIEDSRPIVRTLSPGGDMGPRLLMQTRGLPLHHSSLK